MRFLFLNHNLREHGTWFRAFHLARELTRMGHRITLWTASPHHWYRTSESELDGVRVIETPSWNPFVGQDDGWGPLDTTWRLASAIAEPCDLVYAFAHPPNVYLPARVAQILRRKPMVVDWCDVYRDGIFPLREEIRAYRGERGARLAVQRVAERIEKRLERRIVRVANGVTVISQELGRAARAEGVAEDRLLVYPSGANLEAIRPLEKSECRRALGIESPGPLLSYIANYNPDERFFLAALGRVFRQYPSARLLSTAPPFTESLVAKEGVGGNLIQLGRLPFDRMATVLGAADVLVTPLEDNASNWGRWPNKFGDYLAAGRPIVTNAIGDIAGYFESFDSPGAIGIASAPQIEAFGDAIARVIACEGRWDEMGRNGRHLAETRLSWRTLAEQVEPFLKRFM